MILPYTKEEVSMAYPIDEDRFVDICMKEIGEHDEVDEKVAQAVAITLNWAYYKSLIDSKQRG